MAGGHDKHGGSELIKKNKRMENYFEWLPTEITLDIVWRLSTRSLIRLRCTCKFLRGFLSDPEFTDMHLTRAMKNPGYIWRYSCQHLPVKSTPGEKSVLLAEKVDDQLEVCKFGSVSKLFGSPNENSSIFSSGGLIAHYAVKDNCFHVFNPVLLEEPAIKVPDCSKVDYDQRAMVMLWGFGYCPSSKEYKIVKIFLEKTKSNEALYGNCHAQVYAFNGGDYEQSWRTITFPNCPVLRPATRYRPVECNGTLFWDSYFSRSPIILSFDLETETFRPLQPPAEPYSTCFSNLINVGGSTVGWVGRRRTKRNFREYDSWGRLLDRYITSIWVLRDKTWIREYDIDAFSIRKAVINGEPILDMDNAYRTSVDALSIIPMGCSWDLGDFMSVILYAKGARELGKELDNLGLARIKIDRDDGDALMKYEKDVISWLEREWYNLAHFFSTDFMPHAASLVSPSRILAMKTA